MIVFLFPAFALEAKSRAEAQQMEMKAAAWAEYKEAALVDMMLKVLPEVAREVSTPMLGTKKITMVATGDNLIIACFGAWTSATRTSARLHNYMF